MSIRNAGKTIKEARLKAGMTQEQLSEGICSVLSLSRIENGSAGISPVTFQALMAHAGAPCEVYPIFANRTDFDCFYTLNRARFYLNSWQLQQTFEELNKIEEWHFADNKLYYQEWLYLHGQLQVRSGNNEHNDIYGLFSEALHVTRPEIDFTDFRHLFLSTVEIELLIAIAQESLYLGEEDTCYIICSQIASYLANAEIDYLKKDFLYAEYAIVYTKYLLEIKDYKEAHSIADTHRHKMVLNSEDAPLLELTFLTSLGYYYTGDTENAYACFKNTFYSAHAIESYYATTCRNYVKQNQLFQLDDYLTQMEDIQQIIFPIKKATNTSDLADGTYDFFSPDILTIGKLIHELRTEQNVSQIVLCQGLCSKSKLSKIENDKLQPDIFLAEALLQRLGISERVLTFWGNERESKLYELKFKLIRCRLLPLDSQSNYLFELKSIIGEKDVSLMQFYDICCSRFLSCPKDKIQTLEKAFSYTLPDFNIRFINNCRLSWQELSILNNIAYQHYPTNTAISNLFFSKVIEYLSSVSPDILLSNTIFTMTLYMYSHSLYSQKHYYELIDLFTNSNYNLLKGNVATLGYFLFYYCQALGECKKIDAATLFAHYSCSIQELYELNSNSNALKNYFVEDFSVFLK